MSLEIWRGWESAPANFKVKSVVTRLLVRVYEEFSLVNHVRTVSVGWFSRDYVFSKSFKLCRRFHGNVHDINTC